MKRKRETEKEREIAMEGKKNCLALCNEEREERDVVERKRETECHGQNCRNLIERENRQIGMERKRETEKER